MARSGRFGSLPARAPDLTNTIVALLEAFERERDRNIMSAWSKGGEFEGKPATDQRVLAWFRSRRGEYDRNDPEWDYWDQQYEQVDYQIGESKMLLRYEQGRLSESGASRWYTSNAKRFTKNSEAWREAMRNAASFKKAAQEKAHTSRTVSKSEQYQNRIQAIQERDIEPANRALELFQKTLHGAGYVTDLQNLSATYLAVADDKMDEFLRSKQGRELRAQWRKLTGEELGWRSLGRMLDRAERGTAAQIRVAKQFGYRSAIPQLKANGNFYEDWGADIALFRSGVYDEYTRGESKFRDDLAEADTEEEVLALMERRARQLERLENKAVAAGDYDVSGSLRAQRMALSGEEEGATDTPTLQEQGQGKGATGKARFVDENGEPILEVDPKTGALTPQGASQNEFDRGVRNKAVKNIEGLASGTHVLVKAPDGTLTTAAIKDLPGSVVNDEQYGTDYRFVPDSTYMVGGKEVKVPAHSVRMAIQKQDVKYSMNGSIVEAGAKAWENDAGETIYQYYNPANRRMVTSLIPPWDIPEDDDPRTPPGHVWDPVRGRAVPAVTTDRASDGSLVATVNPYIFGSDAQTGLPTRFGPAQTGVLKPEAIAQGAWNDQMLLGSLSRQGIPGAYDRRVTNREDATRGALTDVHAREGESREDYEARMRQTYDSIIKWEDEQLAAGFDVANPIKRDDNIWLDRGVQLSGFDAWLFRTSNRVVGKEGAALPQEQWEQRVGGQNAAPTGQVQEPAKGPEAIDLNREPTEDEVKGLMGRMGIDYVGLEANPDLQKSEYDKYANLWKDDYKRGVDPMTGEPMVIPGSTEPRFVERDGRMVDVAQERFAQGLTPTGGTPPVATVGGPTGLATRNPIIPALPDVLSEAAMSLDNTGVVVGYASSVESRKRWAAMPNDQKQVVFDAVVERNGWQNDPQAQMRLAYDFDAIGQYGSPGSKETDYYLYQGQGLAVYSIINQGRRLGDINAIEGAATKGGSQTLRLQNEGVVTQLLDSGLSMDDVRKTYPDLFYGGERDQPDTFQQPGFTSRLPDSAFGEGIRSAAAKGVAFDPFEAIRQMARDVAPALVPGYNTTIQRQGQVPPARGVGISDALVGAPAPPPVWPTGPVGGMDPALTSQMPTIGAGQDLMRTYQVPTAQQAGFTAPLIRPYTPTGGPTVPAPPSVPPALRGVLRDPALLAQMPTIGTKPPPAPRAQDYYYTRR